MKLAELLSSEVADLPRDTVVIVPVASLEQHSLHLPVFTDSMILEEFQREIFESALNSSTCSIPEIRRITPTSINIRIPMIYGNFIDMFFNEETGTTAFSLIENKKRILG